MKLERAVKELKKILTSNDNDSLEMVGHDNTPGIDIHFSISQIRVENNAVVLRGVNKSNQHLHSPIRKPKYKDLTPIPEWSCPYVREIFKLQILKFLKEYGLGKGEFPRGFTPREIRETIGGSEDQLRDSIRSLELEDKVRYTGVTKGKKYVLTEYFIQASENFEKENRTKREMGTLVLG